MKIIIASGFFNPLHRGHVSYLNESKKLGDKLFVIVNSDLQVKIKGSKEFMDEQERLFIVKSLKAVDDAMISSSKVYSVSPDFPKLRKMFPKDKLIFAKGGDRDKKDAADPKSPLYIEMQVCKELDIKIAFKVGEDKVQSSSKLLSKL